MEIKKGMKFKAAADSETPDMEFEVIETGLTVDGFNGCKISFSDGETMPTFEITRAYLGYEYNFSKEWYAKAVLDVGDPEAGKHQMAAFLKNAYFQYEKNNFTASFGLTAPEAKIDIAILNEFFFRRLFSTSS